MGNNCNKKKKINPIDTDKTDNAFRPPISITKNHIGERISPVEQWEKRQKELNAVVMEKMKEDFKNRPDIFLLNLLVASTQFYQNFSREKAVISNHIRDREQALNKKLSSSKRKILYMGGFEEISGTHVLYKEKHEKYIELPTPLQIHVVQDNLEVFPADQYEELQQRSYADVDGPSYRFCAEFSKKHAGYVRLRCADIIPGVSRHGTYEDIYSFLQPVDDNQPDPVVDPRPLRRSSLLSPEHDDHMPQSLMPHNHMLTSTSSFEDDIDEEEEEEDDLFEEEISPPPQRLMQRRHSGVLPMNYPSGSLLNKPTKSTPQQNGFPGVKVPPSRKGGPNLESRPSSIFPKLTPNMDKPIFSKKQRQKIDEEDEFAELKRILADIDEGEEDDEIDDEVSEKVSAPREQLFEVPKPPEEKERTETPSMPGTPTRLHASLNTGCFVNRKIKLKEEGDAYGVRTRSELRTYFSSERYLECFEEEFEDLMKILGKEHLIENSHMQMPAILAHQLLIEKVGPKFHTEFIPTLILKEWPSCAFEWKLRERKQRPDPDTQTVYRWPTQSYIEEVTKMGCNLVPIGHYNPSQPNTAMKIEWQIQFTKAEQLLLRSLGHTQIRLLLLVEFLMRDHLKDIPGLKTQHLRYILFWMCEHNIRDWHEESLGNKLKAYFKTLYNCLSTENLPHYFIDKCNLLETIPQRYLRQIQALIRNMKDNLPIYLMHTMRRIKTDEEFYPTLDIKELYKLVTPKRYGMEKLNPALLALMGSENTQQMDDGADVLYTDSDEEEQKMKEELHRLREERAKKREKQDPENGPRRNSTINLKKKVQTLKDLRAGKVLSFFARHFIQMARSSNTNRSYPQAYMYLLLAGNMATLLDETNNSSEADEFRKNIEELNIASRGGVRDMLGSTTYSMTDKYDIIPGNRTLSGSNWEIKKKENQPLPTPPNGISLDKSTRLSKQNHLIGLGSTLTHLEQTSKSNAIIGETLHPESLSDDIDELPDSPQKTDIKTIIETPQSQSNEETPERSHSEKTEVMEVITESKKSTKIEEDKVITKSKESPKTEEDKVITKAKESPKTEEDKVKPVNEENNIILIGSDDEDFGDTYL